MLELYIMENKFNHQKELGAFLLSKRKKISPSEFITLGNTRRRTPGLRREEVATLAKIGVSWYTWLEQGKKIKVSRTVLENICRVLKLTKKEIEYVFSLADLALPKTNAFCDKIKLSHKNILDSLLFSPAFVIDRFFNIIYWNKCFDFIFPELKKLNKEDCNLLFIAFTNESYRMCCQDWKKTAREILSEFRLVYSKFVDNPCFSNKIEKLKNENLFFRNCWEENYVSSEKNLIKVVFHPQLGELFFEQSSYILDNDESSLLKMYIETPVRNTNIKILKY